MTHTPALPFVLDVLDDGLRLYRAYFRHFVLVTLLPLVALAIALMTIQGLVATHLGVSWDWTLFAWLVSAIPGYPLLLVALAAGARLADALLDGRAPSLRAALAWSPRRGCGMVLFNGCFTLLAGIGAMSLALGVSCPLIYLLGAAAGLMSVLSPRAELLVIPTVLLISQVITVWIMVVGGALMAGLVYAVQPFALEQRPFGETVRRAWRLPLRNPRHSLVAIIGAGTVFGVVQTVYLGAGLGLLSLLAEAVRLDLPHAITAALPGLIVVATLALLLPPMAIWMALLYRRMAQAEEGLDLATRIDAWQRALASMRAPA